MISAIVAIDNKWGIGFNGELLESVPADLKYFKELTSGNAVIMGRKTWDSLPHKPLPNRINVIITSQRFEIVNSEVIYSSLEDAIDMFEYDNENNYFIIGGGQMYEKLLPYCDKVYVTKIFTDHDNIDTYFPNLDEASNWEGHPTSPIEEYNNLTYQFWQYDRI